MNCNLDIRDELINCGEISCPFCDEKLASNENRKMIYAVIIRML